MNPISNRADTSVRSHYSRGSRLLLSCALMSAAACSTSDPVATNLRAPTATATVDGVQPAAIMHITSCPALITSAGQYVLDVSPCSGIVVEHSEVELDLQGNTVSGPGCSVDPASNGILILPAVSRVQITNGLIENFGTGVLVAGNRNDLSDLKVTTNCFGFQIVNARRNRVHGDSIVQNQGEGVTVAGGSLNRIDFNVIRGNGGGTIVLASDSNVIASDTIVGNVGFGVLLTSTTVPLPPGANSTQITDNVVDSTGNGLADGIRVDVGSNNTISHNFVRGNAHGISLRIGTATGNVVQGNRARNNVFFDLFDGNMSPPCDLNVWTDNRFVTANQTCIH